MIRPKTTVDMKLTGTVVHHARTDIAVRDLTITPEGSTARSATYDNIVTGSPTTFDVHVFNDAGTRIASAFRYRFRGV